MNRPPSKVSAASARRRLASLSTKGYAAPAGELPTYRLPSETELHDSTWMQWPSQPSLYTNEAELAAVRRDLAQLARTIAGFEPVQMLAPPREVDTVRQMCGSDVEVVEMPVQNMWARDSAPTFMVDGQGGVAVADMRFNAWGDKEPHEADQHIAARVAAVCRMPCVDAGFCSEGGAIEFDGEGTLITTESVMLNANRNPGATRERIEAALARTMGVEKVIWIAGVAGRDITDGHIDGFARFVHPGLVLLEAFDPEDLSPEARNYREAHAHLSSARDARGRSLDIVTIKPPDIRAKLPPDSFAGYANYYVCNGAVVMAKFGDEKADADAMALLRELYPTRKVTALRVDNIHEYGGGIHCATQQEPLGRERID